MQSRIVDEKYQIVRELSQGGMGAVYEARHLRTDRKVALKLILADTLGRETSADAIRRFEREARAGGSIDSRHVVTVTDTGVDAATGNPYIVMELLVGEDLRELLRRFTTLPTDLVLRIASQACLGLERAHERGIVHRDIKSGNIYLARRDAGHVEVKLLDFGIAKLRANPLAATERHDLTRSGAVLGSPLYMAPEQATGARDIDERADLWSLGVVMYEALSGSTPHTKQTLGALILAICSEPARSLRELAPWVPAEVAAIVHKALALEPAQRFESARAMRRAIDALIQGESAISEAMLADAGAEARVPIARSDVHEVQALTPGGQTTADAMTLGHGRPKSGAARSSGVARRAAIVVGVAGIVAAWAISRTTSDAVSPVSVADDAGVETSSSAAASPLVVAPAPAPPPAPATAATASAPGSSASPQPSRAPRELRSPTDRRRAERAPSPQAPAVTATATTTTNAPVRSAEPPVAPPPPRRAEPAIDRRFD